MAVTAIAIILHDDPEALLRPTARLVLEAARTLRRKGETVTVGSLTAHIGKSHASIQNQLSLLGRAGLLARAGYGPTRTFRLPGEEIEDSPAPAAAVSIIPASNEGAEMNTPSPAATPRGSRAGLSAQASASHADQRRTRKCLCCGGKFVSQHYGHRMCDPCRRADDGGYA